MVTTTSVSCLCQYLAGSQRMDIFHLLEGAILDGRRRTVSVIMAFDDQTIESTHDFIQWMFSFDKPSRSQPGAPVLDLIEFKEIKSSEVALENLVQPADWYLGFLQRHDHWIRQYNNNHLGNARTIKTSRLPVSNEVADRFKAAILDCLCSNISTIGERSSEKTLYCSNYRLQFATDTKSEI